MKTYKNDNSCLDVIGIPVTEHCNLNCKGCLHFCNIKQQPYYLSIDQFRSDIYRLKELFSNIKTIRLYGGEPLLHAELWKLIILSKQVFPDSNIEVYTNGLLIPKITEDLKRVIIENHVLISWSVYPLGKKYYSQIMDFLCINNISFKQSKVKKFCAMFNPRGDSNAVRVWENCSGKHCHVLREGNISACPASAVSHIIREYFHIDLMNVEGALNIYDKACSGDKIIEFLSVSHEICSYCTKPRWFEWERQEKPTINDWIS